MDYKDYQDIEQALSLVSRVSYRLRNHLQGQGVSNESPARDVDWGSEIDKVYCPTCKFYVDYTKTARDKLHLFHVMCNTNLVRFKYSDDE
jgi:hypothetical protein